MRPAQGHGEPWRRLRSRGPTHTAPSLIGFPTPFVWKENTHPELLSCELSCTPSRDLSGCSLCRPCGRDGSLWNSQCPAGWVLFLTRRPRCAQACRAGHSGKTDCAGLGVAGGVNGNLCGGEGLRSRFKASSACGGEGRGGETASLGPAALPEGSGWCLLNLGFGALLAGPPGWLMWAETKSGCMSLADHLALLHEPALAIADPWPRLEASARSWRPEPKC